MKTEMSRNLRKPSVPWWEQILRGDKTDLLSQSIRRFAQLSSLGYAAGVKGRELAYRHGLLSVKKLSQPTICVGNITVGGTGKTPLVLRLTTDLLAKGLRPAVLLRGYKRENRRHHPVIVRDSKHVLASVSEAGDEAMELAMRLPGACVGVGADRYAVGRSLLAHQKVDCFVLDDGFQHHRLARDINIVTVDVTDPWGGGKLLPAGLLREPPEALRRADLVVLTRTGSIGPDRLAVLRAEVAMHMRPASGLIETHHEPKELVALDGIRPAALSDIRHKRVLAVSAIGNPRAFENTLTQLGADLAGTLRLADHSGKADQVIGWIQRNRRRTEWVLMTEKDAMRWNFANRLPLPAYALRMDLAIRGGESHWNNLIDLIAQMARRKSG